MEGLRDEADKAKRDCLEVKKIAEEKEILFKQEQAALRKVSRNLDPSNVAQRGKSRRHELVAFTSASTVSIGSFPDTESLRFALATGDSRDFVVRAVRNNTCFFAFLIRRVSGPFRGGTRVPKTAQEAAV